jgi:hypothetical protein
MGRTSAALGNGARLTDFLSTSLLGRVHPSSLIADLLDTHKCNSQRPRSFPAKEARGQARGHKPRVRYRLESQAQEHYFLVAA